MMDSQSKNSQMQRLYQAMIAASFPVPEGSNPMVIARQEAEEALETSRVHMLLTVKDGMAFYLAADSRELAAFPNFATGLAAALPNHPAHVGDAAYRVSFGDFSAAAILQGKRLRMIVGYKHEVATSIRPDGPDKAEIPFVDVEDRHAVRLESEAWLYRTLAEKTSRITALFSMGLLTASVLVALGANAVNGYYGGGSGRSAAKLAGEAAELIGKTKLTQPLGDQMVRIIEVSKAVVETGGWVDSYAYSQQAGESFTVSLPGWVTQEAISKIGSGVQTHKQPDEVNMIWARKPNLKGAYAPGPGPAQVEVATSNSNASKGK